MRTKLLVLPALAALGVFFLGAGACSAEYRAKVAVRKSLLMTISEATSMTFDSRHAIPDYGSIRFVFSLDKGQKIIVTVLHQNEARGGNNRYQEIRLQPYGGEWCEVMPNTKLEDLLLKLLDRSAIHKPSSLPEYLQPSSARLEWLLSRTKDRTIPWTACP